MKIKITWNNGDEDKVEISNTDSTDEFLKRFRKDLQENFKTTLITIGHPFKIIYSLKQARKVEILE